MNIIIFSSTLIFCVILFFTIERSKKQEADADAEFWARERKANFTRKKSLDGLNYVTIPDEILHMQPSCGTTEEFQGYLKDLNDLSEYPIVNLTGYTNTDLKLEYGTANINILSDYDFHYTKLVILLQKLAELLHNNGADSEAIYVLEFAISTHTDVSKSYYLLAELYRNQGTPEKIRDLIQEAQELRSLSKDTILQTLQELL